MCRDPKYVKQKLTDLKREIDSATIILDINNSLIIINKTTRQKINKETEGLTMQ